MAKKFDKKKVGIIGLLAFVVGGVLGDKLEIIQKVKGMFNHQN